MKETNAVKKGGSFFEKHAEIWKFIKFTFAGAFSSLIELGVFALLQYVVFKSLNDVPVTDSPILAFLGVEYKGYMYSYFISTVVGYAIAFVMNRKITFKADANPLLSTVLYAIMVVCTIIFNAHQEQRPQQRAHRAADKGRRYDRADPLDISAQQVRYPQKEKARCRTGGVNMRFNSDGKFKIMQITDIQEIPDVSPDTIKLINAALEEEKPDLVVLTGDQIKGYGVSYKGKGDALIESVAETVGKLLKPVTDRHIPFAVTFGNHDRQVGISNKDQFEKIYKALPGCVCEQAEGIDGGGTYNIPILSSDGKRTAFNLYLFDSGTDAKGGGYEPFDPQIIDWYKKKRDELKAKNGDYIPSLVFQHIPMFEHYNVLKRVGKREKGAIPAFRIHKGEHYKIDETKCVEGSVLLEPPSIPDINTGEFEALSEKDDVLGVYVGHDHKNSYVGKVGNIDVGFTQSAGFNVYGNGKQRGVRCFVLDENDPRNYKTYTKTYEQLCDGKLNTPIKDAIWRVVPTTVDMAKPMIAKALAALAAVVALIVIAVKFL